MIINVRITTIVKQLPLEILASEVDIKTKKKILIMLQNSSEVNANVGGLIGRFRLRKGGI